jgi:hypothetical protein
MWQVVSTEFIAFPLSQYTRDRWVKINPSEATKIFTIARIQSKIHFSIATDSRQFGTCNEKLGNVYSIAYSAI